MNRRNFLYQAGFAGLGLMAGGIYGCRKEQANLEPVPSHFSISSQSEKDISSSGSKSSKILVVHNQHIIKDNRFLGRFNTEQVMECHVKKVITIKPAYFAHFSTSRIGAVNPTRTRALPEGLGYKRVMEDGTCYILHDFLSSKILQLPVYEASKIIKGAGRGPIYMTHAYALDHFKNYLIHSFL